jgi:hypothetical protein
MLYLTKNPAKGGIPIIENINTTKEAAKKGCVL